MIFPELFDKADIRVTVALITGITALATTLLTLISSLFGTPLKYWLEKRALRNRLAVEYEYEQRKNLRELIVRHQGRLLESAVALNHRMWNLYKNQDKGWLDVHGEYDGRSYYHSSFVYRFLNFCALAREFESEAILIDSSIAEKRDLDFVKFVKAFSWTVCEVALFDNVIYDSQFPTDHFFHDWLRKVCDSCMRDGKFLGHEELQSVLLNNSDFHRVFLFFDGLNKSENRFRWDRLVVVHLLLLAFINSFGYDMQKSTPQQFVEVAQQANNAQILTNLASWLPKFGLQQNEQIKLITKAINTAGGFTSRT
jgi:hypothetical protein